MKREFLTELGIESKDVIDKIMAENGKDVEAAKGDAANLQQQVTAKDTEIEGLKGQITQRDKDIADLRKSSEAGAGLQQQLEQLQTKYNTDTADLQKKLDDQRIEFETAAATEKFFADVKFSSNLAREAAINQFRAKSFKLDNGVFQGGKEWLEELKKTSPDAFAAEGDGNTDPAGRNPGFPSFTRNLNGNNGEGGKGGNPAGMFDFGFTPIREVPKK